MFLFSLDSYWQLAIPLCKHLLCHGEMLGALGSDLGKPYVQKLAPLKNKPPCWLQPFPL